MHGRGDAIAHTPVYIRLPHVLFHVFIVIVVAKTVYNVVLGGCHDRTVMAEAEQSQLTAQAAASP